MGRSRSRSPHRRGLDEGFPHMNKRHMPDDGGFPHAHKRHPPERRRSRSKERDRDRDRERERDRDVARKRHRDHPRRSKSPSRRPRSRSPRRRSRSPRRARSDSKDADVPQKAMLDDRKPLNDDDFVGKSKEEVEMMHLMGFGNFDTTKGKPVAGNNLNFAKNIINKRKYRQYMNRKGGFNRPLDFIA